MTADRPAAQGPDADLSDLEPPAALRAGLVRRRREHRVPALSAAVGRAGRVAWADAVGDARTAAAGQEPVAATTSTAFRVGSISKPLTAVAVLRLVAAGRLGLADEVGRHLPDAPAPTATVAQLLTHTSGLPAEPPGPWWERAGAGPWSALAGSDVVPVAEPGDRFHYSNLGFAVLGRLVAEAHGRAWDDVVRTEVTGPLGMHGTGRTPVGPAATGYAVHPHADAVLAEPVADYGAMGPAGEIWSTPTDLVTLGSWLVGAGRWADDESVLPLAWRRRMTAPRVVVDEPGAPFTAAWGLGVSVHHRPGGRRTVGHGGSVPGFTATVRADVSGGRVVAVCGSSTAGFGDADFLGDGQAGRPCPGGRGRPGLAVAPRRDPGTGVPDGAVGGAAVGAARDLALTGTWYWGPVPYVAALLGDGRLELRAVGSEARGTVFVRSGARDDGGRDGAHWVGTEGGYWWGERLRAVPSGAGSAALDVGTFHLTRVPYDPATDVPGGVAADAWRPWAPG